MHDSCKALFFFVLGVILALLFLLLVMCGRPTYTPVPVPIPVPSETVWPEPVPENPVPTPLPEPNAPETPEQRTHTVVCGDTLWDISEDVYGDPQKWRVIWKANKDVVEDPHWIFPGEVLVLPQE